MLLRRSGLFMCERVARLRGARRIDGGVSFINVTNDAFFIDYECGPISEALFLVEDTIVLDRGAFEIAEDREGNSELFGEFAIGGNTVYTHAENLSVG